MLKGALMVDRVRDKVALVIGGGQTPGETMGNGRATAIVLAREGARVFVVDRALESAEETVAMIRGEEGDACAWQADVIYEDQVSGAVRECARHFGHIDLLHNNVGASLALGDATATDLTVEAFDRIFQVNLRGCGSPANTRSPSCVSSMAARS